MNSIKKHIIFTALVSLIIIPNIFYGCSCTEDSKISVKDLTFNIDDYDNGIYFISISNESINKLNGPDLSGAGVSTLINQGIADEINTFKSKHPNATIISLSPITAGGYQHSVLVGEQIVYSDPSQQKSEPAPDASNPDSTAGATEQH